MRLLMPQPPRKKFEIPVDLGVRFVLCTSRGFQMGDWVLNPLVGEGAKLNQTYILEILCYIVSGNSCVASLFLCSVEVS